MGRSLFKIECLDIYVGSLNRYILISKKIEFYMWNDLENSQTKIRSKFFMDYLLG